MDTTNPLALLGGIALIGFLSLVGIYIYFSICLTVLAKKTSTPNPVLAWIPIVQAFYMLKIGRRNGAIGIMYFVPILNMAAFGIAWMSIAEARGKSPWVGILALVPGLGLLIVPWILAAGPITNPDTMWQSGPSGACPNCNEAIQPGDEFCGNCGAAIGKLPAKERMSAMTMGITAIPIAAVIFGLSYFAGNMAANQIFAYNPPARSAPAMPSAVGGTLSYFPLDKRNSGSAQPQTLSVDNLSEEIPSGSSRVQTATASLPPGVTRDGLKQVANSVSTSVYKGGAAPVTVNVAKPSGGNSNAGNEIAGQIAAATGGSEQGVNVNPPSGPALTGERIDSKDKVVICLWPTEDPSEAVIIIHTTPAGAADAEALAQGIGTSSESDGPKLPGISVLPAETPEHLELIDFHSETLDGFLAGPADSPNPPELIAFMRQTLGWLLPNNVTNAAYLGSDGLEYGVAILDYGRYDRGWVVQQVFRSDAKQNEPLQMPGFEGFVSKESDRLMVVAQKGPYLVLFDAPVNADINVVKRIVAGLQL